MFKIFLVLFQIGHILASKGQIFTQKKYIQTPSILNDINLKDVLINNQDSENSKDLIEQLNKDALINYIFILDSDQSMKSLNGQDFDIEICQQKCIINEIFNKENSVISQQPELQAYLYSTYQQDLLNNLYLEEKNQELIIKQSNGNQLININQNTEFCINQIFNNEFQVQKDKIVFQNQTINNIFEDFFKDLCAINKISQLIYNGHNEKNIFTFYIQSLKKLNLNNEENLILSKIFQSFLQKFQQNLLKNFEENEIQGFLIQTQVNLQQPEFGRIMQQVKSKNDNSTYLIQVWVIVVMIFVLWFTLSAMFNMEIAKDTLLYAKFLTLDAK